MPKKPYTLKLDRDLLSALKNIKERDGISESEQIRRGIRLWLKEKGVRSDSTNRGNLRRMSRGEAATNQRER